MTTRQTLNNKSALINEKHYIIIFPPKWREKWVALKYKPSKLITRFEIMIIITTMNEPKTIRVFLDSKYHWKNRLNSLWKPKRECWYKNLEMHIPCNTFHTKLSCSCHTFSHSFICSWKFYPLNCVQRNHSFFCIHSIQIINQIYLEPMISK